MWLKLTSVICLCVMSFLIAGGRCESDDKKNEVPSDLTVDRILEAWKQRQTRIKSAVVTWESTIVIGMDSLTDRLSRQVEPQSPPCDVDTKSATRFVISGDNTRYEGTGDEWVTREMRLIPFKSTSVVKEGLFRRLFESKERQPNGTISRGDQDPDVDAITSNAVWMYVRGYRFATGRFRLRDFKINHSAVVKVRGRQCVELIHTRPGDRVHTFHVTLDGEHLPVQYQAKDGDKVIWHQGIDYKYDKVLKADVPHKWEFVDTKPSGKLVYSSTSTVTSVSLNGEVAAGEFNLDFPVGTRVNDYTGAEQLEYIIK